MKILAGYDDDGHLVAYDMSTPEQEHKIWEQICKGLAQKGKLNASQKEQLKSCLAKNEFEEIREFLNDADLVSLGRNLPNIVEVQSNWNSNAGLFQY